ncbi:MAG: HNH endonuclease [Selenomonadaceae bacterium]|nr:HNH endonuclease [Selenomonadaceae bacterium]
MHHIKPYSKGGTNSIENLILVSPKTHYLIHHGRDFDKRFEKYRKHLK